MKILAFVDMHGNKKNLSEIIKKTKKEKPELIICAGDLTEFGENIYSITKELEKLNTLILMIHGNHESNELIKEISSKLIINLHKKSYELNEYIFFGYGGGGFLTEDKEFEELAKKFKKTIKKDSKIILITHAPPYRTNLDLLITSHQGCKSFTTFIKEVKPILCICGHLHENSGNIDKIQNTFIINPGPSGKILKI